MPRHKIKNIEIGKTPQDTMSNAVRDAVSGGLSVKAAALRYNIPRTTLRRYVKKCSEKQDEIDWNSPHLEGAPRLTPNYCVNQIFSNQEESILSDYFQTMTKLHHGMNPKSARKLAYDLAVANGKKIPHSWKENCTAGRLWFNGFMKRRKEFSIRSAEATSLGRAMGFNKPVVQHFFNNLREIYEKYNLESNQVYNVDETALTTVQRTGKVVASKGQKQVGHVVSSERGTLVTMCGCINALGNSVPPLLVFPRKNFKDFMLKNAPPGTVGAASPSGWMTGEIFVQWLKHFIRHVKPTSDLPVLLIMDNHETHVSLEVIKLAKENNVILLTLPPHTSHKLQPLDKTINFALKTFYNQSCQAWLLRNPGKRISIYDIAELLGESYPLAFTPRNCMSGFRSTGIYPFNSNVFNDEDFLAATVTDVQKENEMPTTSLCKTHPRDKTPEKEFISPSTLKPFPSAVPGPSNGRQRNRKSTEILTSTPVLERIEDEDKLKKTRKLNVEKLPIVKRKIVESPKALKTRTKRQSKYKEENQRSSSESDIDLELPDSDDVDIFNESDKEEESTFHQDIANITVGSFVLVKFATKKQICYYIGCVEEILQDSEFNINFLHRRGINFIYPENPDTSVVPSDEIELLLPAPVKVGGTARTENLFTFSIDLSMYNVK